ncbi:MAG: hypothetical protein JWN48_6149 [Myxococcaceae bacterium]|nr:hypothetical protein [Myxococcaceae bacterium]
MGTLTALVLATPIFGLSLTPPSLPSMLPTSAAPIAQFESGFDEEEGVEAEADSGKAQLRLKRDAVRDSDDAAESDEADEAQAKQPAGPVLDKATYKSQLKKRAKLTLIHRTLGITTWALTGIAVISGTIQWRNMYRGSIATNPCVTGDAWLGQKQCYGNPWFHELTAFGAGAAYFSTLSLALAMPDPDNASQGDSAYAKNLRTHKLLRWVHLSGMVAQIILGVVIANPRLNGGLDRANDYGTLKALSIAHLGIGYVTFGALSWAGTIMLK